MTFLRRAFLIVGVLLSGTLIAATYHVTQDGAGAQDGSSFANAWSAADFNTLANWSATPGSSGQISPGDTVVLNGTISTALVIQRSGQELNRTTILFATDAKMAAPVFVGHVIDVNTRSYITIDGGTNGIIENTDNGTPGSFTTASTTNGVSIDQANHVYVRNLTIRNLYQRTSTLDTIVNGSKGVRVRPTNQIYSNTGIKVQDCTMHDMPTGVGFTLGDGSTDFEVSGCTIYNIDDGVTFAPGWADGQVSGLEMFGNRIYGFSKWDDPTNNEYHHDGLHAFATVSGATYADVRFYNNVVGPDWGSRATSGVYFSSRMRAGCEIFNNVFLTGASDYPTNGPVTLKPFTGVDEVVIYNNVFLGASGGGKAIYLDGSEGSRTVRIKNNIVSDMLSHWVTFSAAWTIDSDYNIGHNLPTAAYSYATGDTGSNRTIAQWQALGFDANSTYADPLLDEEYKPTAGSPAIGEGVNLSGYFTGDADGNARPAVGAWDIGAFQYSAAGSVLATPSISVGALQIGSSP